MQTTYHVMDALCKIQPFVIDKQCLSKKDLWKARNKKQYDEVQKQLFALNQPNCSKNWEVTVDYLRYSFQEWHKSWLKNSECMQEAHVRIILYQLTFDDADVTKLVHHVQFICERVENILALL